MITLIFVKTASLTPKGVLAAKQSVHYIIIYYNFNLNRWGEYIYLNRRVHAKGYVYSAFFHYWFEK